jgi:hypothetical protein
MAMDLKNINWKEFFFTDVFTINSTLSGIDRNKLIGKDGKIPYITRSEKDNGYDSFISLQDEKYKTNSQNVITVGLDTQTVFYQPYKFYTGQNIQILASSKLNEHIAAFLVPLIKRQMEKFNWGGNGATLTRLKRSKIFIPINSKGTPDYAFMEQYMKEKEHEKIVAYKKIIANRIEDIEKVQEVEPLNEKKWGEFKLGELFTLHPGKSKGLNHLTKTEFGVNYLGATNLNNGVLCQVITEDALVQKGNGIAFIRNGEGSMGYCVYKAEDFIATSDISVGYNSNLNRYVGLFITTIADRVRGKYNFGYKRSGHRLSKEILLLPIDKNNNPDYKYMENYMKRIEFEKLRKYLEIK